MKELLKMLAKAQELGIPYRVDGTHDNAFYSVCFDFESEAIDHRHVILLSGNESAPAQVRSEAFWGIVSRVEEDRAAAALT